VVNRIERVVAFRAAIERGLANAAGSAPQGPIDALPTALGVDPGLEAFAWACAVATADPMMYPHLIAIGGADARRGLSPAAYVALVGLTEPAAIALAHNLAGGPPLVALGLLVPGASDLLPIATPWRASPRLVGHFLGDDRLDDAVARHGAIVELRLDTRRDQAQHAAAARIARALEGGQLVVVEGPRGVGRRTAVAECAATVDRVVVALDASRLAAGELEALATATCADAVLRGAVPMIADVDRIVGGDPGAIAMTLARILDLVPGPCAVSTATPGLDLPMRRESIRVALPLADVGTRFALWQDALGDAAPPVDELRDIALRHKLGAGSILRAAGVARASSETPALDKRIIIDAIRDTLADRFGSLVERLSVSDAWDDVILPQETLDQLQSLISRALHAWVVYEDWGFPRQTARGGGIAALLSGPPGTGKTMVAGLLARELGRDLYRVDLSQIISKWVGETEKQLGQVFDAAESGNALLLFDEADSLFAKRTDVKSSSDRYANLEVNYLLQRIETFGGMTVLTTNLDTAIDPAVRRRLAAHVVFFPPEYEERVTLWKRYLATRAPIEGRLAHEELADEYPDMTGANIRNAALAAAFLAAREAGAISMDRVHRAARAEYRAMGRVLGGKRHG
jgi:AAA+ superfamily predicted ATPase